MARSSGGGSRSSGSRSSSRSHSHSSGGSRSGGARTVCSKTPKKGCNQYKYYDRHGKTHYIWCNYDVTQKPKGSIFIKIFILLFYLPPMIIVTLAMSNAFDLANPISKELNPHSQIIIEDRINVIENKETVIKSLYAFYEKTGVTPAVITVSHDEWNPYYSSLMQYALELYYSSFDDEYHWLIVYSEPQNAEFNDWNWEGIIGDNTISAISEARCEQLTEEMQKNLSRNKGVDYAIKRTFEEMTNTYESRINFPTLFILVFILMFLIGHYCLLSGIFNRKKYYKNAVKIDSNDPEFITDEKVKIIRCEYCNGTYSEKITTACPHCNAPVTTKDA